MEKLKPCPFCGGEASLWDENKNVKQKPKYFIVCETTGCRAKVGPFVPFGKRPSEKTVVSKRFPYNPNTRWSDSCKRARDDAVECWNRRTNNETQD